MSDTRRKAYIEKGLRHFDQCAALTALTILLITRPSYGTQPERHHPHPEDPEYGSSS